MARVKLHPFITEVFVAQRTSIENYFTTIFLKERVVLEKEGMTSTWEVTMHLQHAKSFHGSFHTRDVSGEKL